MSEGAVSIVHMGWGNKSTGNVKKWKKRWLVLLSNGFLRFFQDKMAADEEGHIELTKDSV